MEATYSIGAEVSGLPGAKKLNYKVTKYSLKPFGADFAASVNEAKYCGRTNWTANVAVEITASCSAGAGSPVTAGSAIYDIFKLSGNSLTTGDTSGANNGASVEKRPSALDPSSIFTKS